jgi:hypothetical protein
MKNDPLERLYNRNFGLPNSTRRKILDDAEVGSVKLAALDHKVSAGTIYTWRRHVRAYYTGFNDGVMQTIDVVVAKTGGK